MHTTPVSLLVCLRRPDEQPNLSPDEQEKRQQVWQQAWQRFLKLYAPLLYGCARRNGLRPADADELVSEVLQHLVGKMEEFEYDPERGRFRDWLAKVFRNKWREMRRRRPGPVLFGPDGPAPLPDDITPPDEVEYRQYLVRRALELMQAEFETRTWQACWETAALGRNADEVAAELGMTRAAVYKAKSRVLRRLRQELDGLFD